MRALCGAIVTAGAMIGLGLTALGIGTRYGQWQYKNDQGDIIHLPLADYDKPLMFILVFLTILALTGIALTFVGLAYHHFRRHHEHLHLHGSNPGSMTHQHTP